MTSAGGPRCTSYFSNEYPLIPPSLAQATSLSRAPRSTSLPVPTTPETPLPSTYIESISDDRANCDSSLRGKLERYLRLATTTRDLPAFVVGVEDGDG